MDLRAVFWDLDGTLVDSEPHWFAAEQTLAADYGVAWTTDDAIAQVGNPLPTTIGHLIEAGVPLSHEEIEAELMERMRRRIAENGVQFRPGARELVEALAARGTRQALVTMSYGTYLEAVLPWLPPLDHIQPGDSVEHGKPAPDIYLAAMAALDAEPAESLAIEDSGAGSRAILAAGLTPIAVPAHVTVPDNPRLVVIETLEGVTPSELDGMHRAWQLSRELDSID